MSEPTLTILNWARPHEMVNVSKSNLGHTITGVRNGAGKVLYNAWAGEPHKSKHLEQGYEADGLARCKSECERHANSNHSSQQEFQR